MSHASVNFDRSAFFADVNVVFPLERLHELASLPNVQALSRTSVFGAYDHGTFAAVERVNAGGGQRERRDRATPRRCGLHPPSTIDQPREYFLGAQVARLPASEPVRLVACAGLDDLRRVDLRDRVPRRHPWLTPLSGRRPGAEPPHTHRQHRRWRVDHVREASGGTSADCSAAPSSIDGAPSGTAPGWAR